MAHGQVIRAVEFELGNRVVLEGVHAQRHHDHFSTVFGNPLAGFIQRGAPHGPRAAHWQRVVEVAAFARAFSMLVGIAEEERKFIGRVAVDRGEEHIVAAIENVLGAVAMVIVDVKNSHALHALIHKSLSGDGGVIQVAVAAHQLPGSVMTRRAAQGKGAVCAVGDGLLGAQRHLCCTVSRLPGASGDRRAAVETVIAELAV